MENATTVRDWRGRSYLVGPVPADRTRMFRLALGAMAAIGPLQYGFAALLATDANGLILLAACIVFQAVGALPALHLIRRGRLPVRAALGAGAVLTALGLLTVAVAGTGTLPLALAGYAVLGGLGAGAVYGVCSEVVSSWYPDRAAARVSLVTGAFGYGSAPLLVWAGLAPAMTPAVFAVAAVLAAVAIGAAARSLRQAPEGWWPETVEPRAHALQAARLRRTPGAVRQFGLAQALRTRALPALAVILACAGAVSVFDVVIVASTGAWGALALMVALNGGGRAVAMRLSEVFGRRLVLASVLGLLALGQVLIAASAAPSGPAVQGLEAAGGPLLWLGAVAAGLGGGAFYPLVASLVREFFGERQTSEIHAVVYSAKAVAGVLGAVMAAYAFTAPVTVLLVAAGLAALPALASKRLRTPGLPATIPL
ncbi:MFS transporter [Nonomuraea sp. NPDC048826]|uniref:MFS transporter n=1 Tax=Nonomuraea sp. NPDC048826 TaxID=3364347 RepID=UPI00371CB96C